MTPPAHRRTTGLAALLLLVACVAGGCGGGKADATDRPSKSASASTPVTPSPTPTPSPTAAPLSPFEDRAPVIALRSWAGAVVEDVNARHRDFPSARRFEVDTDKVRKDVAETFRQEFDKFYPGAVPFTPVAVKETGRQASITTCVMSAGFALKKPGGKPAEKREVVPVVFTMAKDAGSWRLAGIVLGSADCAGVSITAVQS